MSKNRQIAPNKPALPRWLCPDCPQLGIDSADQRVLRAACRTSENRFPISFRVQKHVLLGKSGCRTELKDLEAERTLLPVIGTSADCVNALLQLSMICSTRVQGVRCHGAGIGGMRKPSTRPGTHKLRYASPKDAMLVT